MNILILNWRDINNPLAGGAETATHEHAKGWISTGHRVVQLSSRFPGGKEAETIDGITIRRMGNHYSFHIRAIVTYLREYRDMFDLIIDEFHFLPYFTPLYAKTKILAYIHEVAKELWFSNLFFPANRIGYMIEPYIIRLYKNIPFMVVSESTRNDLIDIGIPQRNIHLVHNGVSILTSHKKKHASPHLLFLGRLAPDKGIEDALYAYHIFHKEFPDSIFDIAGSAENTDYSDYLHSLVRRLQLNSSVLFHGEVTERKKFDLLRESWLLIHPSVREGWGLTAIEAASQGTPTVGYNVSGLRDSVRQNTTGILVDGRNPELLAQAAIDLISDTKRYSQMEKNAQKWSKEFSWKKSVAQSLQLIQQL
ncbi:MAG: glycosyltransferase family 4 protein [Candidatus Roizmanbacteria bacterium]|nr:glycosyltransferase family 4 protein [Candidatus Roizmanbacteria bacterium]